MLKSAYGEECLSGTSVLKCIVCSNKSSESNRANIADGNSVGCISLAKGTIDQDFAPVKLNVNFKLYEEMID
jgi:hypothetical protein